MTDALSGPGKRFQSRCFASSGEAAVRTWNGLSEEFIDLRYQEQFMMTKLLHRAIHIGVAALGLVFAGSASGAIHSATGTLFAVITADSSSGPDADYFVLNNVTSLGTCGTMGNGLVIFLLKDDAKADRQLSALISARAAGTSISVDVDDTYVNALGYCYVRHVVY